MRVDITCLPALAMLQEWTQLRRSFRYDEYNKIAQVNPPQGPLGKVSAQQQQQQHAGRQALYGSRIL
jgi:hypothetical protein